jgi:O-methyltransferase involved in polyketide biosynthesis
MCASCRWTSIDKRRRLVLGQAEFDPSQRAIVIWDGVTNYLQPEAVDAITRWVGGLARGGRFIFTYIHSGILDGSVSFEGAAAILRAVRRSGGPWTFGIRPDLVPDYLNRRGLHLLADLGADEYRRKIIGLTARPIRGYGFYHAALAEIGG